ncbi:class I SAM-dependent methyltransferase [Shouchella shacheensis]|uniref:class I SAM-dependent methyltransferase n=1 Tax=Shouchella shacheensis TaxID=1649580 RepID=UPI00073FBBC7|nr:class I SAM-dependent methyltransferase [Shouchella shacheensis]
MTDKQVSVLYECLDTGALQLEKALNMTYLEAVAKMGENLFEGRVLQEAGREEQHSLEEILGQVKTKDCEAEDVRKAFQLAVLKGMKGAVQPNHSMTPDAVCLYMSYLANKLTSDEKEGYRLVDLAVGSGNLLTALHNHSTHPVQASGFEVDETLLATTFASANLQKLELALFHQDSLTVKVPEADLVATDLPVGYYPKDEVAASYELNVDDGHAYIHHLMIEQSLRTLKAGGFALLLIPNFLFESTQTLALNNYLKKEATILGLLQLPNSMFTAKQHQKCILLLQKKAPGIRVPSQALLAELPSFTSKEATADMMKRINNWFAEQLGR